MINSNKYILVILFFLSITLNSQVPEVGAQVFIEPGQTNEQVERWFQLLQENNMTVCRIRMFEEHLKKSDGTWDFSRYDFAFDMAERYGVKILATLFPSDESVGGFKFPRSHEHQRQIENYIRAVVTHFKDHKALDTWVLINEPGSGWAPWDDYANEKYSEWLKKQSKPKSHDYLKADFSKELFWRDYTTSYLSWLAEVVRSIDKVSMTHLNNHMLFVLLREYDFPSWMPFLNTLGASIHAAWHLGYFNRDEYTLAIAANCDIIKDAANPKPFWVTELQGGPNTFSGFDPLTPRKEDIAQWLWTCIGSGAKRIVFWTLNARASTHEAGEWAMVDFRNNPTERLVKAGEIAAIIRKEASLFENAKPLEAKVTLLYSPLSMIAFANKVMSSGFDESIPSRTEGAHIKSVLAYYKILTQMGIPCEVKQIDQFDWVNKKDHTLILANMIAIPEVYAGKMETFVANGNKLLVTGMTGLFDEYQHNVFMSSNPYEKLFGATMSEWQFLRDEFSVTLNNFSLPVQNMRGVIANKSAEILAKDGIDVLAVKHVFGKGEVVWIPSTVDLGAWCIHQKGLKEFLTHYLSDVIGNTPFFLKGETNNVTVRVLTSGDNYITVFVNADSEDKDILLKTNIKNDTPRVLYSDATGTATAEKLTLKPKQTLVLIW